MKILILSINYWPEVTGIGAFTTYRAEHLARAGHDVEVCTSFPYYPEWRVPREYAGRLAMTEERNGVKIVRSYLYVPNPVTSFKRILHEGSFILSSAMRAGMRRRPDVLLAVSPPLGLAVTAILLSRMWRIPFVFDVEDLQPDSASDLGMLPAWAVRLLYGLEKAAYRHARLVTTLTPSMRKKIVDKGIAEEKVELFEPRLDDSLLFLFVGNGADCGRIERRAADLGLRNARFLPLLSDAEFRGLLAASGVCLVTQQKSVSEIAFPSKVVTYMAAGRPMVASVNSGSEVARTIRESQAGKVAEPENPRALLEAIRELRAEDLRKVGENARAYARRRWSAERVLGHMEQTLMAIAGAGKSALAKEGACE